MGRRKERRDYRSRRRPDRGAGLRCGIARRSARRACVVFAYSIAWRPERIRDPLAACGSAIFVSTPLYEPFGLAVLEAAQAGCALVLSEIATLRELWDGAADFVPARNDGAVAEAVTCLLRDPERREALGAAARERSRRYSLDRSGEALLAWHREILARSRTGGAWESAA